MRAHVLPTPLPSHPRLIAGTDDWPRLQREAATDPHAAAFAAALKLRADRLLELLPVERVMTGRRLLQVSREALDRITVLAIVAKVSGETAYAERARTELMSVVHFADWNPAHFLDVAEMALAVAIGYDWLFDALDEADRDEIASALVAKALHPSLDAGSPHSWWLGAAENWAQVCHGGLAAAAIAIADREPELAEAILQRALDLLPIAAAVYAPDGIYPEGPMYWTYGTSYHVVLCAALIRLTGKSWGLDAFKGFSESAEFLAQVTAPSGRFFNFGDCIARRRLQAPLFWMAAHFGRSDWLRYDLDTLPRELDNYASEADAQYGHYDMLGLAWLWYRPTGVVKIPDAQSWVGGGTVPVAVLRAEDIYLAIKGGGAAVGHAHMDSGSFILEMQGVRWAVDPGMQDYESLERTGLNLWDQSQASQRWQVFRIGPDAHSILRFDDQPQAVTGSGELLRFHDEPGSAAAVIDLSSVYWPRATEVRRGAAIVNGSSVLFQDEWVAAAGTASVAWQFVTEADVEITGRDVVLRQQGAAIRLRVLNPAEVRIKIVDLSRPASPVDAVNPNLKKIVVHCVAATGLIRVIAGERNADVRPVALTPLSAW